MVGALYIFEAAVPICEAAVKRLCAAAAATYPCPSGCVSTRYRPFAVSNLSYWYDSDNGSFSAHLRYNNRCHCECWHTQNYVGYSIYLDLHVNEMSQRHECMATGNRQSDFRDRRSDCRPRHVVWACQDPEAVFPYRIRAEKRSRDLWSKLVGQLAQWHPRISESLHKPKHLYLHKGAAEQGDER